MATPSRKKKSSRKRRGLWFERLLATTAAVNLLLVLFDLSYISFRDLYLKHVPEFTQWYGQIFKGIEPDRTTTQYLSTVQNLANQLERTGEAGLQSPEAQRLLADLREQSITIVDENPFELADKTGTLERIKNRMRDRIEDESAKDAFRKFWSRTYLIQNGWPQELEFFNSEIRPLIATNYFRAIGENGDFVDRFWYIDIWFVILFGAEFLIRTLYLSIRYKGTNWLDTMLWRWYDLLLLIPLWRWLRVIPVTIRLSQARLVNLLPLQSRIVRGILASVAIELTEIVFIRIIDQLQTMIREGEVAKALLQPETGRRYIDINGVDELQVISQRLISTLVYQVLPQVKPEIEALIVHTLMGAFNDSPVYNNIRSLPGVGNLPNQVSHRIASEVTDNVYSVLKSSLEDEVGAELMQSLTAKLANTFRSELSEAKSVEELQYLLGTILEEIKINYVQRLSDEDDEDLMEKTYRLYETTQMSNQSESKAITVRPSSRP
ncbi:MAG: hypothetical protein WBA57_08265 [Elainellaceae cyanobacterium]